MATPRNSGYKYDEIRLIYFALKNATQVHILKWSLEPRQHSRLWIQNAKINNELTQHCINWVHNYSLTSSNKIYAWRIAQYTCNPPM